MHAHMLLCLALAAFNSVDAFPLAGLFAREQLNSMANIHLPGVASARGPYQAEVSAADAAEVLGQ
ncbi:hypothetical protein G3M48_009814 [Beauveria asiatica]|uniref:Uncharacterized protein n=1 Tax=Beauveria asiatica TaxID=1069075 RepID=A0AAW0S353_9HYPO